jgi:seryl-tRNA(Sec) selenium transferase
MLEGEPTVRSGALGADVVTFTAPSSGDQAGIVCGKKAFVEQIRKNP